MSSRIESHAARNSRAVWVFAGALALFATTANHFAVRVTDLSALRMVDGDVPYRDFWTMYAPGSFTVLALTFAVFGRALILSNILGIVTSAGAVAIFYRLASRTAGSTGAMLASGVVAMALYGTGYHSGFTSYPPALLLILAASYCALERCLHDGWRWTLTPGALLGAAILFKHDIAGYGVIAVTTAVIVTRYRAGKDWRRPLLAFWTAVAVLPVVTVGLLVTLGAGPDMWRNLVQFPLTDFPHVRPESIPLTPSFGPTRTETARGLVHWGVSNFPLWAVLAGGVGLWRRWRHLSSEALFAVVMSFVAFWLHWTAAHVQLNTHVISLAAWSLVVAGASWHLTGAHRRGGWVLVAVSFLLVWGAFLVAERAYRAVTEDAGPREQISLPRLQGITAPRKNASWMRELAAELDAAQEPGAPLLVVANRNDITLFVASLPYWLTTRPAATRYHELHPGITDTERVQREILADLLDGPFPVIVREHRFGDQTLDEVKARYSEHVPVGATLLDEWIALHYQPAGRFGRYELLRRCPC